MDGWRYDEKTNQVNGKRFKKKRSEREKKRVSIASKSLKEVTFSRYLESGRERGERKGTRSFAHLTGLNKLVLWCEYTVAIEGAFVREKIDEEEGHAICGKGEWITGWFWWVDWLVRMCDISGELALARLEVVAPAYMSLDEIVEPI